MNIKKILATVVVGCSVLVSSIALAAPIDDLNAALDKLQDPAGHYVLNLVIPFAHLDTMKSKTELNLQTQPYKAHAVITTVMGKQAPATSEFYETQEGNRIKHYEQKLLHKGDKTKSWTYSYSAMEGKSVLDSVKPHSLLGSVKNVTQVSNSNGVQHLKLDFDSAKLFSNWGVKHAIEEGTKSDKQTDEDFEKEFDKLRKGGDLYGEAYITNGRLTKFTADISRPVKAFENAIFTGVSRKSHSGAIGDWILGMILKTGKSTMTIDLAPLTHATTIPQSVIKSAVPDTSTEK